MSDDEDINPYDLLGVLFDATDNDIKSAYRKQSLKVHPDRNRNNPEAGRKFHELTQAYELLLDPLRRMALDAKLRLKEARKTRFAAFDSKRKAMVDELEERERQVKKAKLEKDQKQKEVWRENERVMDEGRRLREQREKDLLQREQEAKLAAKSASEEDEEPPAIGELDTTVRLKYPLASQPNLTTPEALANLLRSFGTIDTDSIVLLVKSKTSKKKSSSEGPKLGTAVVPFKQIGDAFAAVCASGVKERGLQDVQISWAGNGGAEPAIIGWLKRKGKLGAKPAPASAQAHEASGFKSFSFSGVSQTPAAPSFSSASGVDYESLTLMRLREAERAKLEQEILEQEANEG